MLLLVGLGNPGKKYEFTRHNVGFMAIDAIARDFDFPKFAEKHHALVSVGMIDQRRVMLMKPCTYMNNSGIAVLSVVSAHKITPDSIIVFHDDVALLSGSLRIKKGGGSAGHNGIRSIDSSVGCGYWRVRIGIGPPYPEGRDLSYFVLSNFENLDDMKDMVNSISENVPYLLSGDANKLLAKVSQRRRAHDSV